MIDVKVKLVREGAKIPGFKTAGSACADISSCVDMVVRPTETLIVPTGIALQLPLGVQAKVLGRSGLAAKNQVFVTTGTIDSDYRGEIGVILTNGSDDYFRIKKGDRIAQLDVIEAPRTMYTVVEELIETDRGTGGFGSTGV